MSFKPFFQPKNDLKTNAFASKSFVFVNVTVVRLFVLLAFRLKQTLCLTIYKYLVTVTEHIQLI